MTLYFRQKLSNCKIIKIYKLGSGTHLLKYLKTFLDKAILELVHYAKNDKYYRRGCYAVRRYADWFPGITCKNKEPHIEYTKLRIACKQHYFCSDAEFSM